MRLSNKLLGRGYLIKQYEVPHLPNVTWHSEWWPCTVTPCTDQALQQFLPYYWSWPYCWIWFYLIMRSFHKTFATIAACQQRMLTSPDTWSCHILGLASVLMLRPISPELALFPDLWVSNIPRCFFFSSLLKGNMKKTDIQTCWIFSQCNILRKKRKRSDSVLWQKPLHQQKCQKGKVTTQTTPQKSSIKQRLRTDLGRSVEVTKASQLVWLTGLRAHLPTNRNSRLIKRTHV